MHPVVVSVVTVMFAGHVITGTCVSCTVMVNEHVPMFPDASVAVQLTVVTPTGNVDPLAGAHTIPTPGQLSVAVAV